jgi:hypothetical protein
VFIAQIIKGLGLSNMQTGFTTAIPYALGTIGMLIWGHYSDKKNERRWNLTASCLTMGIGCVLAAVLTGSWWSVIGLSLITIGLYASNAHLFPLPAVFLTGPALASGIAWVNSVGILGGSVSPPLMGWLKDYTGSFAGGLYALAGFALLAAIVAAVMLTVLVAQGATAAEAMTFAALIDRHVVGSGLQEAEEARMSQRLGLDDAAALRSALAAVRGLADGRFPILAGWLARPSGAAPGEQFELGLRFLLDGIARELARGS